LRRDELLELSKLRLDNAKSLLLTAKNLIDFGDYKSSANRSYYAIFNAMRAELALLGIDHKKHSGVTADFRLNFIKTSIFDVKLSDIITGLVDVRSQSDYNDFYLISKDEVVAQLENAKLFVETIEKHLNEQYG